MDGSLLDHYDYSHACADPLLAKLDQYQIPIIPTTSKTRAECLHLRKELGNHHPFICENGAAVYIPVDYFTHPPSDAHLLDQYHVKTMVENRAHWQTILAQYAQHHPATYTSFEQLGIAGIMSLTGLDRAQAMRAAQREYSEPLKWLGSTSEFDLFDEYMQSNGARLLKGGRFIHVSGECDKGRALTWMLAQYQRQLQQTLVTIALGDSLNDVAMLEAADYAIVIRSPVHDIPTLNKAKHVIVTDQYGPQGWVEGMTKILTQLAITIE